MKYYFILFGAALLFGMQILFNKIYSEKTDSSFLSVTRITMYLGLSGATVNFIIAGGKLQITLFSFIMASIMALIIVSFQASSFLALKHANMTIYSTFLSIGGMLLPFIFGLTFFEEKATIGRAACVAILIIVTAFQCKNAKFSKITLIFSLLVFFTNGLYGVVAAIHQKSDYQKMDEPSFCALVFFTVFIASLIYIIIYRLKNRLKNKNSTPRLSIGAILSGVGYGVCSSLGELLLLISVSKIDASVQYPLLSGGMMFVSLILSVIKREKPNYIEIGCSIIGTASLFLMLV